MSYYDETAEKSILGAAILDPRVTATTSLNADDFGHAIHGAIWDALHQVQQAKLIPDPATITAHLNPHINRQAALAVVTDVIGLGIAGNAPIYAATIKDRAERRRIAAALAEVHTALDTPETPAEDVLGLAEARLRPPEATSGGSEHLWTLDSFLDRDLPDLEWTIPGLLAAGDRLVLTGVEGFGKSILMRQIGVCVAAGVHPFDLQHIPPKRVLLIDCENPERIMMSRLGELRRTLNQRGTPTRDRFHLKRYPQGLNLANPRDRLDLHHTIREVKPDLLLIGPAYKLYVGGSNAREEDLARLVTSELDGLREEHGFALILEHHSPHGTGDVPRAVRPIGSSLWLRWPEFGLGLRPEAGSKISDRLGELTPWRGSRDERAWPTKLEGGGIFPWTEPVTL